MTDYIGQLHGVTRVGAICLLGQPLGARPFEHIFPGHHWLVLFMHEAFSLFLPTDWLIHQNVQCFGVFYVVNIAILIHSTEEPSVVQSNLLLLS